MEHKVSTFGPILAYIDAQIGNMCDQLELEGENLEYLEFAVQSIAPMGTEAREQVEMHRRDMKYQQHILAMNLCMYQLAQKVLTAYANGMYQHAREVDIAHLRHIDEFMTTDLRFFSVAEAISNDITKTFDVTHGLPAHRIFLCTRALFRGALRTVKSA